jgi:uncharacterized protein (DUF58 family)
MANFVVFILILFALAALLRVDFFFTIFYLFAGIYLASRFWMRRARRAIVITRDFPPRAFLGEQLTVKLTVHNQGRLPLPWLVINETFSTVLASPPFFQQVLALGGQESHTLEYPLTARRRGFYDIGPMQVETGDLLGLTRGLRRTIPAQPLIVYPKIVPIARLRLPTHSPQVVLPTPVPLFKDPTRMTGVQPYQTGDNPRHIHWPATATQGRLLVKQFESAIARDSAVFLNLDLADYGRSGQAAVAIELAVVAAASVANHILQRENLPAGLFAAGLDPLTEQAQQFRLPPAKGRGQLMQMLEVLARVEGTPDRRFIPTIRQESVHLSWGTTVTVITGGQSDELLLTLLSLKRAGFQVALVLVQPAAYAYPPVSPWPGIGTIIIQREKDIERWQPTI